MHCIYMSLEVPNHHGWPFRPVLIRDMVTCKSQADEGTNMVLKRFPLVVLIAISYYLAVMILLLPCRHFQRPVFRSPSLCIGPDATAGFWSSASFLLHRSDPITSSHSSEVFPGTPACSNCHARLHTMFVSDILFCL